MQFLTTTFIVASSLVAGVHSIAIPAAGITAPPTRRLHARATSSPALFAPVPVWGGKYHDMQPLASVEDDLSFEMYASWPLVCPAGAGPETNLGLSIDYWIDYDLDASANNDDQPTYTWFPTLTTSVISQTGKPTGTNTGCSGPTPTPWPQCSSKTYSSKYYDPDFKVTGTLKYDCLLKRNVTVYRDDVLKQTVTAYVKEGFLVKRWYDANNFAWFQGCPMPGTQPLTSTLAVNTTTATNNSTITPSNSTASTNNTTPANSTTTSTNSTTAPTNSTLLSTYSKRQVRLYRRTLPIWQYASKALTDPATDMTVYNNFVNEYGDPATFGHLSFSIFVVQGCVTQALSRSMLQHWTVEFQSIDV